MSTESFNKLPEADELYHEEISNQPKKIYKKVNIEDLKRRVFLEKKREQRTMNRHQKVTNCNHFR